MKKKPNLAALESALKAPPPPSPLPAPEKPRAYPIPPSRAGLRHVGVWVTEGAKRTLRDLSAREDRSRQSLLEEALADLLRKYKMPASD